MVEDTDTKHGGRNGKKDGASGSSFFTWFIVIALLGVWTSVAVVWFDLVDYEDVLGKLDAYDADGDGDFDVDDAKILLGRVPDYLTKRDSKVPGEEPALITIKPKPKGSVKEKIKEQFTKLKEKIQLHLKEPKTQEQKAPKEPKAQEKKKPKELKEASTQEREKKQAKELKEKKELKVQGKVEKDSEKPKEKRQDEEPKRARRTTSRKTFEQDKGKRHEKKAAKESKNEDKVVKK